MGGFRVDTPYNFFSFHVSRRHTSRTSYDSTIQEDIRINGRLRERPFPSKLYIHGTDLQILLCGLSINYNLLHTLAGLRTFFLLPWPKLLCQLYREAFGRGNVSVAG
jgi:hypothetical protein